MKTSTTFRSLVSLCFLVLLFLMSTPILRAQDTVTGALEGQVLDENKAPVADALVEFIGSGGQVATRTDAQGRYSRRLLPADDYVIRVSKPGYVTKETPWTNYATRTNLVIPPIYLTSEIKPVAAATPEPSPAAGQPTPTPRPAPVTTAPPRSSIAGELNQTDARRGGAFPGSRRTVFDL